MRQKIGVQLLTAAIVVLVQFVVGLTLPTGVSTMLSFGLAAVVMAVAVGTSVRSARLTRGRVRGGWVVGAVFCGLMVLVMAASTLGPGHQAVAGLLGAVSIIAIVLQVVQLGLVLPKAPSIWSKLARLADIAAVTAALGGVAWQFVILPISGGMPPEALRIATLVEVLVTAGAAWALVSIAGTDPQRHGYAPHLLSGALAVESIIVLLNLRFFVGGAEIVGHIVSSMSLTGACLTALAGMQIAQSRLRAQAAAAAKPQSYRWLVLPYLPVVFSFVVVVIVVGVVGTSNHALAWVLVVTTAMAIARQFLSLVIISGLAGRLDRQANNDSLTGLPNRAAFYTQAAETLDGAAPHETTAIFLIDLDGFKGVNDTLGHATGDALLVCTGEELTDQLAGLGMAARLGGDEFVVLVPNVGGTAEADAIAAGLVERLGGLSRVLGIEAKVGGSVGVALAPGGGHELSEVLGRADTALYAAKAAGKNTFRRDTTGVTEPTAVLATTSGV